MSLTCTKGRTGALVEFPRELESADSPRNCIGQEAVEKLWLEHAMLAVESLQETRQQLRDTGIGFAAFEAYHRTAKGPMGYR